MSDMTFPTHQWRCGEVSPGQRLVSLYWKQVHHRIDGQRLEALLMWPEIVAVLGARPSTWGLEVQCGLVHASFQRFCMRSRDLIMRCIVYQEVWCIYLFYTLLWILRESTIAFGLNRRYSHWVWHCDRPDSLRRYGWDEELWIVLVQLILSEWGDQLLCNKMLRHYEDNAFIILTGVSGCSWHQACQLCEPDVYSGLWTSLLWSWLLTFPLECELVIAVDDIWQRNNCIDLNLHWGCRIEHSILHRGLKQRDVVPMRRADLEMRQHVSENVCLHVNVLLTRWV